MLRLYLQQSYDGVIWSDAAWKDLQSPVIKVPSVPSIIGVSKIWWNDDQVIIPIIPVDEPPLQMKLPLPPTFDKATVYEPIVEDEKNSRIVLKLSFGAQYAIADGTDYAAYVDAFDRLQPLVTLGIAADNLVRFGESPWGLGFDMSVVYAPYLFAIGSSNPTGSVADGGIDWNNVAWRRFSHIIGFSIAPKVNFTLSDTMGLSAFGGLLTSFPSQQGPQDIGWEINRDIFGWTAGLGWTWDVSRHFTIGLDVSWNGLPAYRHYIAARMGIGYRF